MEYFAALLFVYLALLAVFLTRFHLERGKEIVNDVPCINGGRPDRGLNSPPEPAMHAILCSEYSDIHSEVLTGSVWYENKHKEGQDAFPLAITNVSRQFGVLAIADGLGGRGGGRLKKDPALTGARLAAELVREAFANQLVVQIMGIDEVYSRKLPFQSFQVDEADQLNVTSSRVLGLIIANYNIYGLVETFNVTQLATRVDRSFSALAAKIAFEESIVRSRLSRKLPSTFSSLLFEEQNSKLIIRATWAGDSRAYILTDVGLSILSIDEQRDYMPTEEYHIAGGEMTNYVSEQTPNSFRSHVIVEEGPCMLFVCSDGVPEMVRDVPRFEHLILSALQGATSLENFENLLRHEMYSRASDDCSIAFAFVGFSDLDSVRRHFMPRFRRLSDYMLSGGSDPVAYPSMLTGAYSRHVGNIDYGSGQRGQRL